MSQATFQSQMENLKTHHTRLQSLSIIDLFEADDNRFDAFSLRLGELVFDYSKNHLDGPALSALVALAKTAGVESAREAMFSGEKINATEGRAVLHTALRNLSDDPVMVDGEDVMPGIRQVLVDMAGFTDAVRSGDYQPSGEAITDVVNIGIGGSDLGPRMVAEALAPFCDGPNVHFVANVDGADLADTLKNLHPKTTLFIIASKTFTTQETMANAHSAQAWVKAGVGEAADGHFAALSTNLEATSQFGIPPERTFGFWDWVGGRYSVWCAIGLSVMMAVGKENFHKFLQGGHEADQHFRNAPLEENIPVLMALIGIWHRNVCGYAGQAMLPYDNRLVNLPRWLQQLDMESNGKSVTMAGSPVLSSTGPVIFGEPGTNGQHAFYQLIHQGTDIIPCDFLVAAKGHEPHLDHQHKLLVANCLAQSQALMKGRTLEEAGGNPHRVFTGNRPSSTFLYEKLTPRTLGMLLAFYEHKIFVQGVIWGINSFDQWGVELGKELCKGLEPVINGEQSADGQDASTVGLVTAFQSLRD